MFSPKRWPEEAETQVLKINSKGLDHFLAEYMRMIFKGWPNREEIVLPGQPSLDRIWRNKFKNFMITHTYNTK